jgi:predicted RNase H-like HicB family nuclease
MDYQITAIYHKVREGYVAFVEELPGASSQGATLEEARENLREAIEMVIDANRTISGQELGGAKVIREPIKVSA